ncbi:MAG: hypothetical protein ACTSRG_14330 [Candidatus Helarchaeota archaeon]
MILKEDNQKLVLFKSKRSMIKYIILLLISIYLLSLYVLSIFNLFNKKSYYLGSTLSNIVTQLTFLILGNVIFIIFIIIAIYGSLKNIASMNSIVFDKNSKKIIFLKKNRLIRRNKIKELSFNKISEIQIEQEKDSIYVVLLLIQEGNRVLIDSDYENEGMERLNSLGEKIKDLLSVPIRKGIYEDIYKVEEEKTDTGVKKES